ncbi:MAG TPA: phosphoenolpyruvate carboxylase, partial [Candidatus Saccharimonadales bacterium]
ALKPAELDLLKANYPNLTQDFEAAGHYLNRSNLDAFAAGSPAWQEVKEDVLAIEEVLGLELGPQAAEQKKHLELSGQLIKLPDGADGSALIAEMGVLRKSLG